MAKLGVTKAYRFYADRFYLDRANRDTYIARNAAADILLSGNLALPALSTLDGVDLSVHAADLSAHMADSFQLLRTGNYFLPWPVNTQSGVALVANRLWAMPLLVARALTIDRLAIHVSTAGAASTVARLGIYNNGTNNYPGTLLLDGGTVAVDSTGVKELSLASSQALTKGLYWLALVLDGAPTLRLVYISMSPIGQISTDFSETPYGAWMVTQTYGALPDPFTAGGAAQLYALCLYPRLLTLD